MIYINTELIIWILGPIAMILALLFLIKLDAKHKVVGNILLTILLIACVATFGYAIAEWHTHVNNNTGKSTLPFQCAVSLTFAAFASGITTIVWTSWRNNWK